MLKPHDKKHDDAPEHAESASDAPPTDPTMTRAQFIQSMHNSVNAYAEHWDQGRSDPKHPEPTTLSAWKTDFETFLNRP